MTHTDEPHGPHHHDPAELHNEDVAHEHSDVNIRGILMFAVGLVIIAVVVHILMWVMFRWMDNQARENDPQMSPLAERAPDMPRRTTESPFFGHARGGAQLLTNEPMALRELRADEDKRLHGYGWVEGKPGVAHMPIEEAKKLILERGLPTRGGEPIEPTTGAMGPAMGEASSGRTIPIGRTPSSASGQPSAPPQPDGQQH